MLNSPHHSPLPLAALCLGLMLGLVACAGDQGASQAQAPSGGDSTPSEDAGQTAAAPAHGEQTAPYAEGEASGEGEIGTLSSAPDRPNWVLPAQWRHDPGQRPMRHSTYLAPVGEQTVEVAISQFAGDVGGMVANVNRWRTQLGLGPVSEAAAEEMIERFAVNAGFSGYTIHLEGSEQHMLIGSIFEEAANRTWYVRATTSPALAAGLRQSLFDFARSFGQEE